MLIISHNHLVINYEHMTSYKSKAWSIVAASIKSKACFVMVNESSIHCLSYDKSRDFLRKSVK